MAYFLLFMCYLILTYSIGYVPQQRCESVRAHFPTAGFVDVTFAIIALKNIAGLAMVHKEGGFEFCSHSPRGHKKEQNYEPTFCFMIPVVQKEFEMHKYQPHYWAKYICGAYGCKYHGSCR